MPAGLDVPADLEAGPFGLHPEAVGIVGFVKRRDGQAVLARVRCEGGADLDLVLALLFGDERDVFGGEAAGQGIHLDHLRPGRSAHDGGDVEPLLDDFQAGVVALVEGQMVEVDFSRAELAGKWSIRLNADWRVRTRTNSSTGKP